MSPIQRRRNSSPSARPGNTWTIQIQVADGRMITALERIAPGWGGVEGKEHGEGVLIWDVSDPVKPEDNSAVTELSARGHIEISMTVET